MRRRRRGRAGRRGPRGGPRGARSSSASATATVGRGGAQRVQPCHADGRAADGDAGERRLRRARLGLTGVHAASRRDGDEGEGGAAVVRDESAVVRGRVRSHARLGQRRLDLRQGGPQLTGHARGVDGLALGHRDDRHERCDVAAVAVDGSNAAVGDGGLGAREVELPGQRVAGRPHGRHAAEGDDEPQADDQSLVGEDPSRESRHRIAFGHLGHPSLAVGHTL